MTENNLRIAKARLLGACGTQARGLLTPIILYKMTGSAFFAGLSLFFEWLPKLAIYLLGGGIFEKMRSQPTHLFIETVRVLSFGLMALAVYETNPYWVLASCTVISCCNGLSNILFETLVSSSWDGSKASGHAKIIQMDAMSGIFVPAACALLPIMYSVALGALFHLLAARNVMSMDAVHARAFSSQTQTPMWDNFKNGIRIIFGEKRLLFLAFCNLLIGIPLAMVTAAMPWFLALSDASIGKDTLFLGWCGSLGSLLIFSVLHVAYGKLAHGTHEHMLRNYGILLYGIGLVSSAFAAKENPALFYASVTLSLCGMLLYYSWSRDMRQRLIPEDKRFSATGILIAMEALSYICASVALASFPSHIFLSFCVFGLIGIGAISISHLAAHNFSSPLVSTPI